MNKKTTNRFIRLNKIISEHWVYTLLAGTVLLILLLPLFILCFYMHPQTLDNYLIYKNYQVNEITCLNTIKEIQPGKRFISYFFTVPLLSLPKTLTIDNITSILIVYRSYAAAIIVLFCLCFFYVMKIINTFYLKLASPPFFFLYSLLLFIIVNSLPRIDWFFYEMTVTTGYTLGISFSFLYIGLLMTHYHTKKKISILLSSIVLFFLCATIEYFTILAGYAAFVCLLSHIIVKKQFKFYTVMHIAYCLFAFYLFTLAPGSAEKIAGYSGGIANPHSINQFIKWLKSMNYETLHVWEYVTQCKLIPILILTFFLIKHKIPKFNKYTVLFIIGNYSLCYIMALAIFILGITDFIWVGNVIQIPYILMVINTLFLLFIVMSYVQKNYRVNFIGHTKDYLKVFFNSNFVLLVVFIVYILYISVAVSGLPVRQAWKDVLKGTAKNYNTEVHKIYEIIQNSKYDIAYVQEITDIPPTLITSNLTSNLWSATGPYSYAKQRYTEELAPFFYKKDIIITGKK